MEDKQLTKQHTSSSCNTGGESFSHSGNLHQRYTTHIEMIQHEQTHARITFITYIERILCDKRSK